MTDNIRTIGDLGSAPDKASTIHAMFSRIVRRYDLLNDLIDGVLGRLGANGARRVMCAVRGYQQEAVTALERAGFAPVMVQTLYLKYTTANVRLPVFEAVPLHVDVREKLPKRVPTFLHGQPSDESATGRSVPILRHTGGDRAPQRSEV